MNLRLTAMTIAAMWTGALTLLGQTPQGTMWDVTSEEAIPKWSHKTNTTVARLPAGTEDLEQDALRFTIDPEEYAYGWIHTFIPENGIGSAAGLLGRYRTGPTARGQLLFHLIVQPPASGQAPSYFRYDVGDLEEAEGNWVEFFIPFTAMRHERGPVTRFQVDALGAGDRLQFLATLGNRTPATIDLTDLVFLTPDSAAPIHRRLARARTARLLVPETQYAESNHPRLLLTPDRSDKLRQKASAGGDEQQAYERLLSEAERYLASYDAQNPLKHVLAFRETHSQEGHARRAVFEGTLTPAVRPIEPLAAAYVLTGDKRFGKHAAAALVTMARQLTVHDSLIDEGFYYTRTFYVRALAFGYDWLWPLLSSQERILVKTTLLGFVLDIHARSQTDGWGRRPLHRVWNWDPGLMGACGVGMLALEGETRTAEKAILFDCRRHLRDYLTLGIDQDGCGHEGPSYIGYGIGAGVEFAEILRQQGRGDLFTATNYHLIPPWLIAETLPDGKRWNNLSDCGHGQVPWPVYLYACGRLAELAQNEASQDNAHRGTAAPQTPPPAGAALPAEHDATSRIAPLDYLQHFSEEPGKRHLTYQALTELMGWAWKNGPGRLQPASLSSTLALAHVLFYRQCPAAETPADYLPDSIHFRGRGLVVSRTGYGPKDIHLAIEAGPHAAGHDQCDKGTFTFRALGADLVIDSGYGNDGEPRKSGSSHAHNVVLIDGQGQPMRYHNQSSGAITGFHHSPVADWIRLDAWEAWNVRYGRDWEPTRTDSVEQAERSLLFVRPHGDIPGYLVIHDNIRKDKQPHNYTWQWHIPPGREFTELQGRWRTRPRTMDFPAITSDDDEETARATFAFELPEDGAFEIVGLVRSGGEDAGKSDSFFLTVDDGERILWDTGGAKTFVWRPVVHRGEDQPNVFALEAGQHHILLEQREPETQLARLLILPAGTERPLAPDEAVDLETGILLGLDKAVMGETPFTRLPPETPLGPDVIADLFPVHPGNGTVATSWFETSREGAHPRLHYTVQAVNPNFLFVMVPGNRNRPTPQVVPAHPEQGVGTRIDWGDTVDTVWFTASRSHPDSHTTATFFRHRQGHLVHWMLMDGDRLEIEGREIHTSEQRGIFSGPTP